VVREQQAARADHAVTECATDIDWEELGGFGALFIPAGQAFV
jgi:hypothetical protein